jgi:hypothetical protein
MAQAKRGPADAIRRNPTATSINRRGQLRLQEPGPSRAVLRWRQEVAQRRSARRPRELLPDRRGRSSALRRPYAPISGAGGTDEARTLSVRPPDHRGNERSLQRFRRTARLSRRGSGTGYRRPMEIDAFACVTRIPPVPSQLRLVWHRVPSRGLKLEQVMGEQNRIIYRRDVESGGAPALETHGATRAYPLDSCGTL